MPYGANTPNPGRPRSQGASPSPPRRAPGAAGTMTGAPTPDAPAPAAQAPAAGAKKPTTAQSQRARVGHLRGAIQSNKVALAEQRRLAASGTADERRRARMAQGPIIDRIKAQAAQREKEIARAKRMGWTDDDLKPRSGDGRTPQAPRVAGGSDSSGGNPSSGGGSGSGGSGAKSTRSVTPRKRDFTVDQKNAKANTVLGKALKMYGDPRKGPDKTGEMVQDGAKSPHHVKLTGKEFQDFKKKYISTHAGGKNLSDWSLRAMAKMLKYKNTKSAKETYGLSEYKPPEG